MDETGRHRKPPSLGRRLTPLLTALAVLVVLVGGAWGVGKLVGGTSSRIDAGAKPAATSARPTTSATVPATAPAPKATTKPKATHPPKPAATLVVDVIGAASYLRVHGPGGKVLAEGVLRKGMHRVYTVHPLDVVIGDAGAVRLTIKGAVKSPAGRPGQVLRFRVA